MLYSPRRVAAAAISLAALAGSIALAGCASGSNATITHNPPLSTFGGKSTARSAVQSAILVADTSNGLAFPGGPTPASIAHQVLDVMHGRRISAATGPCVAGKKTSQTTGSTGAVTTTTDQYYDAACATLEEETVLTVATPGSPTTSASGSITTFDHAAAVTSYHVLTISATKDATSGAQTVNYNDAASATVGGTVLAAVGATCTGAPNSAAMNCTEAMYGTASTATFGQSIAQTGTAATTAGGNNTVAVSIAYFGSGITGIAQSSGSWVVTGASAFNTATASYTYTSTGTTGSGTFSLADSLYTYTVTGTLAASGLSVTIVRGTDPIATATVDTAGNGLITYADASTDAIWADVIDV